MKTLLLTAAVAAAMLTTTSTKAASPHHVDALAVQMQREAAGVARYLQANYRHHPRYNHLYNDAVAIYRQAAHIHAIVHSGAASRRHVVGDVRELDRLLHHTQRIVAEMAADLRRHIQDDHFHGGGHGHGAVIRIGHGAVIQFGGFGGGHDWQHRGEHRELASLRQLQRMLAGMELTVHHLQDDIRGW